MCGIAGVVSWSDKDHSRTVKKMTDLISHRGPDDWGIQQLKGACLGHRRLSIVDLSQSGHQPMADSTGRYWIVFNGEIYGFKSIKQELAALQINFKSHSDTEVLLEGFKVWGIETLCRKINGMFAFALWDNVAQTLYMARDRFGEKPLYYLQNDSELRLCSFSKALYVDAKTAPQLNPDGVVSFLHQGFCSQNTPILKNLKSIAPGTYSVFKKSEVRHQTYWKPDFNKAQHSVEEWSDRVEDVLMQIVREELISDVPTGALLSGGVDSSLIASMATEINPDINLFTVKMNDPRYDESQIAKAFAKTIKGNHHIIEAESMGIDAFQKLQGQFSEPLGDSSAVAMWIVSQAAKKHTTVVLTGDGGDEFFAGYNSIKLALNVEPYRKLLNNVFGQKLYSIINRFSHKSYKSAPLRKVKTFLRLASASAKKYHLNRSIFPDNYSSAIVGTELQQAFQTKQYTHELDAIWQNTSTDNEFEKLMFVDIRNALLNDYIPKVDVASMFHGLEARAPMLHHKLAELSFKMPMNIKRLNNSSKGILKKVFVNRVGAGTAAQIVKGKRGFVIPVDAWFDNEWKKVVDQLPNSVLVKEGWLDRAGVQNLLNAYKMNPSVYSRLRYNLIALDTWYQNNWSN